MDNLNSYVTLFENSFSGMLSTNRCAVRYRLK